MWASADEDFDCSNSPMGKIYLFAYMTELYNSIKNDPSLRDD